MCILCTLAGANSGGLNCVNLIDGNTGETPVSSGDLAVGAPPAFSLNQIIQQLRTQWGGSFEGATLSWTGTSINYYVGGTPYASGSDEIPYKTTMTSLMQSRAALAFELWDDLIARDLNPTSIAASAQIQFEYATRTDDGTGAVTTSGGTYSQPNLSSNGTSSYGTANYRITRDEIWLNSNWTSHNADNDMFFGGYGFQTYMHEIGHSLGLSHPGTYNAGSGGTITYANSAEYSQDNRQYTIMSYFGGYAPGAGWQQDGTSSNWLYSWTPMLHDVAAMQAIYGADMNTRTGDTTYGFHASAGVPEVFNFAPGSTPIVTVWDAGGNDTLDLSGYSASQRIDLRAGTYSDIAGMLSNFAIAYNVVMENAVGGSGNDTIIGNDADNSLRGGGGNDTIDGGVGLDTAVFSGLRSAYVLTDLGGNSVRVVGPDGTDVLSNVERLQFDDQTISWPSAPDLTATLVLTGVTANVIVSNNGSGSAAASAAGIYLSTDSTITTADTLLGTRSIPALGTGASNAGIISLAFPGNLTPGTYYLGAIADVSAQVAESNEQNNTLNVIAVMLGNNNANSLSGTTAGDTMFGLGGNDSLNGGAGADMLTGGAAADRFVFDANALTDAQSGIIDRVTDYDQGGGAFNATEGDQFDFSAILSAAYNNGGGQPVSSLVRAVVSGAGVNLQIDSDGLANGANWLTVVRLDGVHANDSLNVILSSSQPAGTAITVAGAPALHNFDAGASADILWQHNDGTPAVWLMNGTNVAAYGATLANPGASWHEKAAADFNGDGKADILWQNNDGTPAVWLMNGTGVAAYGPTLHNPGPSWHEKTAADFDGDGKADILWQHDDGTPAIWLMNGTTVAAYGPTLGNPGPAWHAKDAADFNGDGKADILWQNDDGTPSVWLMNGTSAAALGPTLANPGPAWHEKAAADFNGDGKADILWQHDDGTPAVWLMDGINVAAFGPTLANPGTAWHIKDAADFNADGKADILWQHNDGTPAVWLMDGTNVAAFGSTLLDPGSAWHIV